MKLLQAFIGSCLLGGALTIGASLLAAAPVSADGLCDEVCGCPGSGADCCSSNGVLCYKDI